MSRRQGIQAISTLMAAVLTASVVVAMSRVAAMREIADGEPDGSILALRFLDEPDPNVNPFGVDPGGPGAPGYPTLPGEIPQPKAPAAPVVRAEIPAVYRAATQRDGNPASFGWALIVAINDYAGGTRDNIGSYQDGVALRNHLLARGWQPDHVLLIGNRTATRPMIMKGLEWLAEKTDERSTVVFHYSGHEKPAKGNPDGDREGRDVALWVSDNRLINDGELGRALGRVRAGRMWINLAVCRAGGFDDPGMSAPGRVITYSSPERELSYEDTRLRHSIFGYYVIVQGMREGAADLDQSGTVAVEEAFHYATPLVSERTGYNQHPEIDDRYPGDFELSLT